MAKKIPWPAEIMGIGQFSDMAFNFGDGYIYMGSGYTWVPFPIPEKRLKTKVMPEPDRKSVV